MTCPVTVDVSVLIRSSSPTEPGNQECVEALLLLGTKRIPVILPTLMVVELAGALSRRGQPRDAVEKILDRVRRLPAAIFVPLDEALAEEAAELAADAKLRGGDAVYVATARRGGAVLVTVDEEQRLRVPPEIRALLPSEFVAENAENHEAARPPGEMSKESQ